jgi:hypothetical protein
MAVNSTVGNKSSKESALKGISAAAPAPNYLQSEAAGAAYAHGGGALLPLLPRVCEEPDPVDTPSLLKAFKAPKTISDFFKKVANPTSRSEQQNTAGMISSRTGVAASTTNPDPTSRIASGMMQMHSLVPRTSIQRVLQQQNIQESKSTASKQSSRNGGEQQSMYLTIQSDEEEGGEEEGGKKGVHAGDIGGPSLHFCLITDTNKQAGMLSGKRSRNRDLGMECPFRSRLDQDDDELEVIADTHEEGEEMVRGMNRTGRIRNDGEDVRRKSRKMSEGVVASRHLVVANAEAGLGTDHHLLQHHPLTHNSIDIYSNSHNYASAALRSDTKAMGARTAPPGTAAQHPEMKRAAENSLQASQHSTTPCQHKNQLISVRPMFPSSALPSGITHPRLTKREALQLMSDLGFTGKQAEVALFMAHGDVNKAAELCISGSVKMT